MDKMKIEIPELCLVALVGASSSGKTSFAKRFFLPTEVLSSDYFRAVICDDENDQNISREAFDLLYYAAKKRLTLGRLTVVDATNLHVSARQQVLDLAREQNVHPVAIVLDMPESLLQQRNRERPERNLPERVISKHHREVKKCVKDLKREGFRFVYVIKSPEQLDGVEIVRTKMWSDRRDECGPFDVIGDIHGCGDELELLLSKLGYVKGERGYSYPEGRRAAFLGDFCDRGNRNADVLRIVMEMVSAGNALAVPGNHDVKLLKYLKGKTITMSHGIAATIAELDALGEEFKGMVAGFLDGLVSHYVLDGGRLIIAHAGIKEEYAGRGSARVRDFCLYGETTGETDEYGLPVRLDWAADYRGKATVVYGHVAGREVKHLNGTVCIDTGCVFGGKLTAYRYPEREIVSVDALTQYYMPVKPLDTPVDDSLGDMLNVSAFNRRMHVTTTLIPSVDIHENNAAAALETMSRYAADPHWLIYLPPTMSPCETSPLEGYLEHPLQAFAYFRERGVRNVVCEKKHMGSRAVIVLCRDAHIAGERFGITDGTNGIIYTRTGRRFFEDGGVEKEILDRLNGVLTSTGFWKDFETGWVCLDTELMPWSDKAQSLLRTQYAPTGRAGKDGLTAAVRALERAAARGNVAYEVDEKTSGQNVDPSSLLARYKSRLDDVVKYVRAYGEYCWQVRTVDDYKIAPFHILACEGKTFCRKEHVWHMETVKKYMTGVDGIFVATPYICVDTEDGDSVNKGVEWWLELTSCGGEGMVVKPETFIATQDGQLIQPAVKCRGREYLRIIYGAEYLEEEHLARLKTRSLSRKRSLALKEFSLGVEALTRFINGEPLYRVHECAFGVLALESEPVDPRL